MNTYGTRLEAAIKHSGKLKKDVAHALGVSAQALTYVLNGQTKSMTAANNEMAARLLGVSSYWLATGEGQMMESNIQPAQVGMRPIPLISFVQAGNWAEAVDSYAVGTGSDYLLTDLELSPRAFALQIKGDSMAPDFKEGDRIIIDPDLRPQPGDFVVAKNGSEETTFKKYRLCGITVEGQDLFELLPLNPDYPTLRNDIHPINIVGVMVEHRKYRRR